MKYLLCRISPTQEHSTALTNTNSIKYLEIENGTTYGEKSRIKSVIWSSIMDKTLTNNWSTNHNNDPITHQTQWQYLKPVWNKPLDVRL